MNSVNSWLPSIRSEPEKWLAAIIRSGDSNLALELIRENPDLLHARFSRNDTPLLVAAYSGQHQLAESLLAMGAKMDFITGIVLRRSSVVREMLDRDPGLIRKHSPDGWTALHIAARYADSEMLSYLISAGASVHHDINKVRVTPLFFAREEPYDNAGLLLAKGANIDARAKHGFTVLHYAAMAGNKRFVEYLVDSGARIDLQTEARQTPWALAVRRGHRNIAALL